MKRIVAMALIISITLMSGCANNMTSRDYNEATAGKNEGGTRRCRNDSRSQDQR